LRRGAPRDERRRDRRCIHVGIRRRVGDDVHARARARDGGDDESVRVPRLAGGLQRESGAVPREKRPGARDEASCSARRLPEGEVVLGRADVLLRLRDDAVVDARRPEGLTAWSSWLPTPSPCRVVAK
jgi:hypothetical protein